MAIPILWRDAHLVVADKPAGVPSVDSPQDRGLPARLREEGLDARPVHRLDRDVSGAIVLALGDESRAAMEELFRRRAVRKSYWAMAAGRLDPAQGRFHAPILEERGQARVSARGRPALTIYRTLQAFPAATELEIDLETGRLNQIRVHFAHAGHALIGERKYARGRDQPLPLGGGRIALHAWKLAFVHPITGASVAFEAPLPAELLDLRERAREPGGGSGARSSAARPGR